MPRPYPGWQRQAEPVELADGVGTYKRAIGKLTLAAATRSINRRRDE
jgi:hypothetical protein